jgi:TolB protein
MTISELEETYQQLHEQLLRGELDEEEFNTEVDQLRYEDDLSRQWKIGWYTGKWYRYDQGQWVLGKPIERQEPVKPPAATQAHPQTEGKSSRRSLAYWLAGALIILLLAASVVLIVGWNTDWWSRTGDTAGLEGTMTTTVSATSAAATQPPAASASEEAIRSTPMQMPSRTPSPTATPTRPPTRSAPPTDLPSPTASPQPTVPPTAETAAQPSPTSKPAFSGQIFFPLYDDNPDRRTFDIYVYRLESGDREIVIGQASQPSLSPDGKRLAFRSWDRAQTGILVRELTDGNTWLWINFVEAARPSWSPDSQAIVFPSQQESDRQWRIYRSMGLEYDRVRRHGGDIFGRVPVWLKDGRIVYWECPLDKCGLYVMQGDGSGPLRLTMSEHDTAPSASPDGSQIAFMSNQNGNWEIYVVSTRVVEGADVQEPIRLTRNGARDGLPTWSPDGSWLAFASDRGGAWAVWVMRPDGSDQQKLFDLGGQLEGEIALIPLEDQHGWTWETIAWGR